MFTIKAIQAENGDALLVSYGGGDDLRHVLIDGGTIDATPNLLSVLSKSRRNGRLRLEALVVTHYDLDHIDGVLSLLRSKPEWLDIEDIWFNGRKHLIAADMLGTKEGDELSTLIDGHYSWNGKFGGKAIRIRPNAVELDGGMKVCVLSPDLQRISALAAKWPAEKVTPPIEDGAGRPPDLLGKTDTWPPGSFINMAATKFYEDSSVANGSSIALMLGYEGKLALLAGDAFPSVMRSALNLHWPSQKPEVALLKLSHHGSKANTDDSFLKAIECRCFLFSTNGKNHKHPDFATIARVLNSAREAQLIFNYDQSQTTNWRTVPNGWPTYTTVFAEPDAQFVIVNVTADLP